MQAPPNVPHGFSLELWHGFFATTVLAILAAVRLWLNRKKPSADVHESEARTGKTWAETSKSFGEAMSAMLEKIAELQDTMERQRDRHEKQVLFLQGQVEIKTESEQLARERSHRAIAEVQRCIMAIRDYEEMMRGCDPPVEFTTFDFKTYEEIMSDGKDE